VKIPNSKPAPMLKNWHEKEELQSVAIGVGAGSRCEAERKLGKGGGILTNGIIWVSVRRHQTW